MNSPGTETLFGLLEKEPSQELKTLASSWTGQGHISRMHDSDVFMLLSSSEERVAADLIYNTDLKMQVTTVEGHHLLKEPAKIGKEKGHGPALRWLLAIVWIFSSVTSAEATAVGNG